MGINSNRIENFSGPACLKTTTGTVVTIPLDMAMPPLQVHKVALPQPRTTVQKLRHRLSEIFFPDDPLHKFKNQTWYRKLVLGLQFFFPIFQWAPNYSFKLLKSDVISGLTIASLAIPQVLYQSRYDFILYFFLNTVETILISPRFSIICEY